MDVRAFAERLIGERLWSHQAEVLLDPARTRAMCCGRQSGKTRTVSVGALHGAYESPGFRVLILSAGENAARDVMAEIIRLSSSPLLAGSTVDENASRLVLSNGSSIRCVPASEKQVRGKSVDLLVVDEACQVSDELWRAARYSIIARPESRIILASTPFGSRERWFARTYHAGLNGAEGITSFHWPSTVSPMVDAQLVEEWRRSDPEHVHRQEVLAEWIDDAAAYFSGDELLDATADYALLDPQAVLDRYGQGNLYGGAVGLDWGFSADANAGVMLAPMDTRGLSAGVLGDRVPFYVPWLAAEVGVPYNRWIDRLMVAARAFRVSCWASECNGVGAAPTQSLRERMLTSGIGQAVRPVWTDNRRKLAGYSALKVLLQQQMIVLPRHPELLRQLNGVEYSFTAAGSMQIAVPDGRGHDDLSMALVQAASCVNTLYARRYDDPAWNREREVEAVTTGGGVGLPAAPLPLYLPSVITAPSGGEASLEAAW
jgi:hypothetical protein